MRIAVIGVDDMTYRNITRVARGRGHAVTLLSDDLTAIAAFAGHDVLIRVADADAHATPCATVYRAGRHPVGIDYTGADSGEISPAAYAEALLDGVEQRRMGGAVSGAISRRALLRASLALPVPALLAACGGQVGSTAMFQNVAPVAPTGTAVPAATAVVAIPTPMCGDDDDDDVTPAQTEGPYYTPRAPERSSLLEPGMPGTRLLVAGYVLTTSCQPVARALVDFWQADDAGVYDNAGFRLRGHQFSDASGRYTLETVMPGCIRVAHGTFTSRCRHRTGRCSRRRCTSRTSHATRVTASTTPPS